VLLLLLQMGIWSADSLLAEGKLAAAESAYYAEARAKPRSPVARAALGKYLAARGGTRAGAVLLDEARFFGGDSASLARSLVPLFVRLGDYKELVALQPNVLTPAERARARWLATRQSEALLRDSVVILSYRAMNDGSGMGTVLVRIGKTELPAVIDPRASGLVVPSSVRPDVRAFGAQGRNTLGVVESARIGGVVFSNVPVTIGSPDEAAKIGFDVLAPYFPAFDPARGLMTLRRVGRRSPSPVGLRLPALYDADGMRLLINGRWHSTTAAAASMLLATRRWIWDWKLGDVVLLP
jgi:hypothetical protein